jgi:hypothetical protein
MRITSFRFYEQKDSKVKHSTPGHIVPWSTAPSETPDQQSNIASFLKNRLLLAVHVFKVRQLMDVFSQTGSPCKRTVAIPACSAT